MASRRRLRHPRLAEKWASSPPAPKEKQDISGKTRFEYELAMEMKRDAARKLRFHINDLAWLAHADCSHQIWSACANMLTADEEDNYVITLNGLILDSIACGIRLASNINSDTRPEVWGDWEKAHSSFTENTHANQPPVFIPPTLPHKDTNISPLYILFNSISISITPN
ncbi:hypothetical protein LXL04_036094 [Taraxacum kok-saghyz]